MAIASICHVTVTVCQSEVCISVPVLVGGGVDSCLHERDMAVATISYWNGRQLVWTPALGLYTGMDN